MHRIRASLAGLALAAFASTASAQIHVFNVLLDGTQEVPSNNSAGTGVALVEVDEGSGKITVSGTYTGLGSARNNQHVHAAPKGTNGGVILPLSGSGTTSGTISGSGTLTAAQVQTLLSGGTYINVHSANIPGGEIRGQIVPAEIHTFEVALDGSQEVPPNTSTGTGEATVRLDAATGAVTIRGTYQGLSAPRSNQHVHAAPRGTNGGVLIPLTGSGGTSGTLSGNGVLTPAQVQTMLAGGMYVNVHSTNIPGGELRGQITQCQAYFKFDRGLGNVAVNYGSATVLGHGTLVRQGPASSFVAGQPGFGQALQGTSNSSSTQYNYCDTGFKGPFSGDMTVSWWMKERVAPGTALSYVWGGIGNWRCFTNGVAGTTLWMRNWNTGTTMDIILPTVTSNIQVLAQRAQGVFVALVVDSLTDQAQWFVDGQPNGAAIALPAATAGMLVAAATSGFKIGKHTSDTNSSAYDLDEFRLCNRAASAGEIQAWHRAPSAASGPIGTPCGLTHRTTGGTPSVGNANYGQAIDGPSNYRYLFVVGGLPTPGFNMGIAFPELAGCTWYARFDVQIPGATRSPTVDIPTAIPNSVALIGVHIDSQVLGFDANNVALMSNAMSQVIERN